MASVNLTEVQPAVRDQPSGSHCNAIAETSQFGQKTFVADRRYAVQELFREAGVIFFVFKFQSSFLVALHPDHRRVLDSSKFSWKFNRSQWQRWRLPTQAELVIPRPCSESASSVFATSVRISKTWV